MREQDSPDFLSEPEEKSFTVGQAVDCQAQGEVRIMSPKGQLRILSEGNAFQEIVQL